MSFTYTAGGATDLNRIRARLGDTDQTAPTNQRLEDEEIADFLVTEGSFRLAAVASARGLAAKFLRLATTKTVGNLTLIWQRRYEDLIGLANELQKSVAMTAAPLAGGMSLDEKRNDASNADLVQPAFKKEQFDNPRSGTAAADDATLVSL